MRVNLGYAGALMWIGLWTVVPLAGVSSDAWAEDILPPGEVPFADVQDERPHYLRLQSGKLFRVKENHSETSADDGETWKRGGWANPFTLGSKLNDVAIQLQSVSYKGRIVIPFYLLMRGVHPDYSRAQRGGYAIFKGKKIVFETHAHIPEMSGSFVCYSDDEGKTWKVDAAGAVSEQRFTDGAVFTAQ